MYSVIASVGSAALVSASQSQSTSLALGKDMEARPARQATAQNALVRHVTAVWSRLIAWKMRRATRVVLSSLDDRTLDDIGLRRSEIDAVLRDLRARTQRWPV